MKLKIKGGTTSRIARIFVQDATSAAGAGLTGLTQGSSGLKWYYSRVGDAGSTAVTPVSATAGTFTSAGFVAVDGTNMPGVYEVGLPNAALAAGSTAVHVMLYGATNMVPVLLEIELDAVNYQDAAGFGLSNFSTLSTAVAAIGVVPSHFTNATFVSDGVFATASLANAPTGGGGSGPTAVAIRQEMDANSTQFAALRTGVIVTDKTGFSLASSGLDAIVVEVGINARQALSPVLAASAGVVAGAGTGVVVIKGGNTSTTRITATTDNAGNRSSVTLTLPT